MADSQEDIRGDQPAWTPSRRKADSNENEIDLADYLRILWKRRLFIVLCSVLPALLVGLILLLLPGNYRVTYAYNIERDRSVLPGRLYHAGEVRKSTPESEKAELNTYNLEVLIDRFYSTENLNKLAAKLRENGVDEHSSQLSKTNAKLETSRGLLLLTVIGRTPEDVQRISAIVKENLEEVMPVYFVKDGLIRTVASVKSRMSDIEKSRFYLQLALEKKKAILVKLRKIEPIVSNRALEGIVVHFDHIRESWEYLPLAYQIQATDANIINIEETIGMKQAEHKYYETMLRLNEGLAGEIEKQKSSYYTIGQYHLFLADLAGEYKDGALADYLSAYTKEIENLISINTPLLAKPGIHLVPRDNVKRATIVFVALLMISTFVAFLSESVQKSKAFAS